MFYKVFSTYFLKTCFVYKYSYQSIIQEISEIYNPACGISKSFITWHSVFSKQPFSRRQQPRNKKIPKDRDPHTSPNKQDRIFHTTTNYPQTLLDGHTASIH